MGRPKKEKPNRADGLYEIKITIGKTLEGKYIRKSFYSSISKEDARRQAEEWRIAQAVARQTGEIFVEKEGVLLCNWAEKWLATYIRGKVKDNSYRSTYELLLEKHILPYFGNCRLSDVRSIDIQRFLDKKAETLSVETLKKLRARLKNIFDTAIENKLCTYNPVTSSIKIREKIVSNEKRFYTQEDRDRVVEYAKTHKNGLPIILMLYTGISRSELLGLRWEDVTPDCTVHVNRGVTLNKSTKDGKYHLVTDDGPKNIYRKRAIPIPRWLYNLIQAKPRIIYLGGSKRNKTPLREIHTEYIFYNVKGEVQNPNHFYHYVYQPFMEDMQAHYAGQGIHIEKLNPHELRHTAATLWGLSGIDVYTIAKLGGWSDLKMLSKVYGHSEVESLRKALNYSEE